MLESVLEIKCFRRGKYVKDKYSPGLICLKSRIRGCSCSSGLKLEEGRCICPNG